MESWSFLTNHARVLLCIARDPGVRLRDIAASLGITERSAHGIVTDLTAAGYLVKHKDGRRNRYQIQAHLPLPEPASQEPAIGDVLAMLAGGSAGQNPQGSARSREQAGRNDGDQQERSGLLWKSERPVTATCNSRNRPEPHGAERTSGADRGNMLTATRT